MKRLAFFLIIFSCIFSFAQRMSVNSFAEATYDLSASTSPRADLNGRPCGLVKVQAPLPGLLFEGNIVGDANFIGGEYWVYLTEGSLSLKIKHNSLYPLTVNFSEFGISAISPKRTYILELAIPAYIKQNDETPQQDEFSKLLSRAGLGDAEAQYNLGKMYYDGSGVTQDYVTACQWYNKAAEQGHVKAQFSLGTMYDRGESVTQDYSTAFKWFRKAAEQGHDKAQFNLGQMYSNGKGVKQNDAAACQWYRKAAEEGNASAQNNLGLMYINGKGVTQDYSTAFKWFRKAAEQGLAGGRCNLGYMYYFGLGIEKDRAKAKELWEKAAAQGDAYAKNNLAKYLP